MPVLSTIARRLLLALLALAVLPALAQSASGDSRVHQRTLRSTGWVIVHQSKGKLSTGTCWVFDSKRRLVVSNKHVVGDSRTVNVYFPRYRRGKAVRKALPYVKSGRSVRGRVLQTDESRDLALIQLERLPAGVRPLPLAPARPKAGDILFSVGNSGVGNNLRTGRLWKFKRSKLQGVNFARLKLDGGALIVEACLLASRSRFDHGDSGGPLVNGRGQLVGVVDAKDKEGTLGISIDAWEVRQFLARALRRPVRRPVDGQLAGPWKATFPQSGKETLVGINFGKDGRMEMIGGKVLTGRYRYAEGVLRLELKQGGLRMEGSAVWAGADRFTVKFGDTAFAFQRR
jgi:S1-C subfamily serine protease